MPGREQEVELEHRSRYHFATSTARSQQRGSKGNSLRLRDSGAMRVLLGRTVPNREEDAIPPAQTLPTITQSLRSANRPAERLPVLCLTPAVQLLMLSNHPQE